MSKQSSLLVSQHEPDQATLRAYVIGFGSSIILTLAAYLLTLDHGLTRDDKMFDIAGLALVQFVVQLIYFLHLGREFKPRWKLLVFLLMIVVVLILVIGSLWIMSNLNYHMSLTQMERYMTGQDGL